MHSPRPLTSDLIPRLGSMRVSFAFPCSGGNGIAINIIPCSLEWLFCVWKNSATRRGVQEAGGLEEMCLAIKDAVLSCPNIMILMGR